MQNTNDHVFVPENQPSGPPNEPVDSDYNPDGHLVNLKF